MATLGEEAKVYESPQTKNIADLQQVDIDLQLYDGEGMDKQGKTFKYKYIEVNGEEYRVPGKVLGDIKEIQIEKPDMKTFKVSKKGEGLNSKYTVIPMD